MSTAPLQSRDAVLTKTTRDGTQALLDFLAETEPPPTTSASNINAVERSIIQRGPSLGGLSLEKAKARLGLLSKSKKKKVEEEGEKGSLRINTPPPGTVAITRNSGHTVYMIGLPTPPPQPVLPVLPPTVFPPQSSQPSQSKGVETSRPESRIEVAVHQNARDTSSRDTSGPGRSLSPDRHERVQPPSYNEATERISIFIDACALQAIQESRGSISVEFLDNIRAAQRDQDHFQSTPSCTQHQHSRSQSFIPPVQTTRRPLPPLPRPRSENVDVHHHCGQITLGQMAVTPSRITGRSESGVSKETNCDKCECTLEHHPVRPSILESHSGNGEDPSLPKDGNSSLAALAYSKIPVPGRSEAAACTQAPANPTHRMGVMLPPHSSGTGEESLHIDELNVVERKLFSKMEKALLRKVEFGSKVDNCILQLC